MSFFGINTARADWITEAPSVAELLMNGLKYVLSAAGLIAILALVYTGVMYITSGGDTEKAQKAKSGIIYSVAGLTIVLLAYAIVRTIADVIGQ